MTRYTRKTAAERFEASTTSTSPSVSSVPFSNSNTGSTANTPATSGEDEEGFNLQRKVMEKVMRTTGKRRKRSAESDGDNPSISTRPPTKRRAIMKAVCVEIPFRSPNVSMPLMVLRLIVIAYLKTSKDKGKGRAPSNLVDGVQDNFVPDSEADLNDEVVPPSDDDVSEFEAHELSSEDEDEDDRDFILRNSRKSYQTRTSRAPIRRFRDVEEEEAIEVNAAIKESIRDATNGGASTSASSASRKTSRRVANAAAVAERRSVMERGSEVNSDVVSDSDPEGEVMVVSDTEDEPIVQRSRPNMGKGRGKNKGPEKTDYDTDDIRRDYIADRKEARRLSRLEKQEIRMQEIKLGRRLTYVGLTGYFYSQFLTQTGFPHRQKGPRSNFTDTTPSSVKHGETSKRRSESWNPRKRNNLRGSK